MHRTPEELIAALAGRKVVVLGDLVADQFLSGTISRVSREAPVFILRHDDTETRPGGAANAAANIASLGGAAEIVGILGTDANASLLRSSLGEAGVGLGGIVDAAEIKTTTKVRVLAGQHYAARQQVIRIDYENGAPVSDEIQSRLADRLQAAASEAAAIVVSDYGYGVVSAMLYEKVREIAKARSIPVVADSRFRLTEFVGATSATPNQDEVEHILGKNFTTRDCEALRERLGLDSLLVTRGNKGMLLIENGRAPREIDSVGSTEPVDVTGAGDTVIAAYALGVAAGLSYFEAAEIANHAGGIVVMKKGTATATAAELADSINANTAEEQADAANPKQ